MAAGSTIGDYFENALPTYLGGLAVTPHQLQLQQQAAAGQIAAVGSSPGAAVNTGLSENQQLVNGQTYTFIFTGDGTSITPDVIVNAFNDAGFAVTGVAAAITGNTFSISFTYEGNGTDTVTNYANAITAAVLTETNGAGPVLSFVSGSNNSQTVGQALVPVIANQITASNADQAQLAAQANAAAKNQDTNQLFNFGIIGVVLLIVGAIVLFVFLKAQPKVSVGG